MKKKEVKRKGKKKTNRQGNSGKEKGVESGLTLMSAQVGHELRKQAGEATQDNPFASVNSQHVKE